MAKLEKYFEDHVVPTYKSVGNYLRDFGANEDNELEVYNIIKDVEIDVLYKNLISIYHSFDTSYNEDYDRWKLISVDDLNISCGYFTENDDFNIKLKDYFSVILKEKEDEAIKLLGFSRSNPRHNHMFPTTLPWYYSVVKNDNSLSYQIPFNSYEELIIKMDVLGIKRYD